MKTPYTYNSVKRRLGIKLSPQNFKAKKSKFPLINKQFFNLNYLK